MLAKIAEPAGVKSSRATTSPQRHIRSGIAGHVIGNSCPASFCQTFAVWESRRTGGAVQRYVPLCGRVLHDMSGITGRNVKVRAVSEQLSYVFLSPHAQVYDMQLLKGGIRGGKKIATKKYGGKCKGCRRNRDFL